jgi:hypothetical protein
MSQSNDGARARALAWTKAKPVVFAGIVIISAAAALALLRKHLLIGVPVAALIVIFPAPGFLLLRLGDHLFIERPILKASRRT